MSLPEPCSGRSTAIRSERAPGPHRASPSAAERIVSFSTGSEEIDFSIVIPAHNRPQQLADCLAAISQLDYPAGRYEVVVVDDGSDQSMEPTIAPWIGRLDLTLLRQSNAGPAAARNAGAAVARGRWLAFTDDDCRPEPGWLDALARDLTDNPECAAGGPATNGLPENPLATASELLLQSVYRHFNADERDAVFLASNNLALPRRRFLEIGGFDTAFPLAAAEDRELCDRWRWRKGRIVYVPRAEVRHFHDLTLRSFLAQHFNYGRGAFLFFRVKLRRDGWNLPFASPKLYALMLAHPYGRKWSLRRSIALSALIALSQVVMWSGFLWQGFRAALQRATRGAPRRRGEADATQPVSRGRSARSPGR